MKLILLGAPGSGKGTQASFIAKKYNLAHISTGDIFRQNMAAQTPLGIKVKEVMEGGNLCPDDLTIEIVKDRLSKPDCQNGYLLDGFPRNLVQAKALDEFMAPDKVIDIEVDLKQIEHRLVGRRTCSQCKGSFHLDFIGNTDICPDCGGKLITRKEDNPETIHERLSVYASQTKPLESYYEVQGKLFRIDGSKSVEQVFEQIVKVLG